ncbi:MAG: glycerol-3-phosphate dehydrogenase, partial [Limnothrix sp. RL_2_0]|nr:glycerol-3-phosphate dehydrogenase [Limnothrix sp. RL_2_0]
MANQKKMTVIGAGVWGTALGSLVERNYPDGVTLWSRRSETALVDVVQDVEFVLSAVSMKGVLPTIEKLKGHLSNKTILITATKGLDPDTMRTPSQLWQEAFPDNPVVVLSGPNLSKEIM